MLQLGSIYKNNDIIWKINLKLDLVNVYILKSSNNLSVMVELYKYKLDWNLFKSSSPLARLCLLTHTENIK